MPTHTEDPTTIGANKLCPPGNQPQISNIPAVNVMAAHGFMFNQQVNKQQRVNKLTRRMLVRQQVLRRFHARVGSSSARGLGGAKRNAV
jgi:hypothetical protein